jgi:hypothetical protein
MVAKRIKHRQMSASDVKIRLRAASKFLESALLFIDESDAASWQVAGSNAVSAGIAASDAICGYVLGYCAQSDNHFDALDVLAEATLPDRDLRKHLAALLNDKSDYQYGTSAVQQRAARGLVQHAQRLVEGVQSRIRDRR